MANTELPASLWGNADPSVWFRQWSEAMRLVPQSLDQKINPGWFGTVINVTSGNSTAPQTEVEILQRHSYGRQLGRLSDVLAALLKERVKGAPALHGAQTFLDMKKDIDDIKRDAAKARIESLVTDVASLKAHGGADYQHLKARLLKALED